ncbi:hypothetical protein GCM10029964_020800 [Kibdelosporangium lantanae]
MNAMIPIGPNALRHGEAMMAILRAGGLSVRRVAFAFDALGLYCKAYAAEASFWQAADFDQEEMAARAQQMSDYMTALPAGTFPNMLAAGQLFSAETAGSAWSSRSTRSSTVWDDRDVARVLDGRLG